MKKRILIIIFATLLILIAGLVYSIGNYESPTNIEHEITKNVEKELEMAEQGVLEQSLDLGKSDSRDSVEDIAIEPEVIVHKTHSPLDLENEGVVEIDGYDYVRYVNTMHGFKMLIPLPYNGYKWTTELSGDFRTETYVYEHDDGINLTFKDSCTVKEGDERCFEGSSNTFDVFSVADSKDLELAIDKKFGEGCKAGELRETSHEDLIEVDLVHDAEYYELHPGDPCVAGRAKIFYSPKYKKALMIGAGHDSWFFIPGEENGWATLDQVVFNSINFYK